MIQILSHPITPGYEFTAGFEGDLFVSNNAIKASDLFEIAHHMVCICLQFTLNFKTVN